jgi:hypothetical protein
MNKSTILIVVDPTTILYAIVVKMIGKHFAYVGMTSSDDEAALAGDFQAAVIDRDFGGEGQGWNIAKAIRDRKGRSANILVISKNRDDFQTKIGLYDWMSWHPRDIVKVISDLLNLDET